MGALPEQQAEPAAPKSKDVEMKEAAPAVSSPDRKDQAGPSLLSHLKSIAALVEKGVSTKEMRLMVRAVRNVMVIKRKLKPGSLAAFVKYVMSTDADSVLQFVKKEEDKVSMEVDMPSQVSNKPNVLPELEILCYLLVLIYLHDQKQYKQAKACADAGIKRLQQLNRRTLDVLASRLYFYYSLSYECIDSLADIRGTLLSLHQTATLRHDELGQETLLNLLLRNYLHYNLYDQAEKLRSKSQRAESHANQQLCRYLFYLGKIRTIQLEYTDAKDSLMQAARKAPTIAHDFRIQCNKWAVIVRLLLGEIPERTTFMQRGMKAALRPYFELTNAVRIGDLELFKSVADNFSPIFSRDKTHNLIVRLRHNVIRTGLRNISISYSRISLADVAAKLHLSSDSAVSDAESMVAKAIRDGGIDAVIDHARGFMQSRETGDIYSTQEPQLAFHSRIAFCLNTYNDAVKALRFPPNAHKKELESAEKRRERQQQEQELAKHIAEEEDDDF
ncbi:probable 26S proteasome non-ATPase regulatory subunit 3 isoform X2 [Selaginella moellendorffii]|uniref:probable 26S proteasome non-ATPase regulatory subunit 3 isoform X2 n=1 Tax=Selaginella moellendorffii TaxID=88036 RepID=UPI000D1C2993|nr:probable 26S proteasome non-ATPase regulatory subunit 3 isoform X2 [Selaginella moellendorffii]XP_024539105.1 probable 26S proteasome non-ATPase regulatory subunit 3 isoform X2 [Selaginella moellendorffii]|eukprot:XP_024530904.1 probable 26S proteasome non-ATPase regulatory subunit 3 isoform X2 [Selaginella moellendorffii]